MTQCQHEGCTRPATHLPKINVPASGHAIDLHQPIGVIMGLQLCKSHAAEFDSLAQFAPEAPDALRRIVETMAGPRRARPDFARAFTSTVRINSAEGAMILKAQSPTQH